MFWLTSGPWGRKITGFRVIDGPSHPWLPWAGWTPDSWAPPYELAVSHLAPVKSLGRACSRLRATPGPPLPLVTVVAVGRISPGSRNLPGPFMLWLCVLPLGRFFPGFTLPCWAGRWEPGCRICTGPSHRWHP